MDSIEMKIAKTAAEKWEMTEPTEIEEAKGITDGSEISSVKAIVSVLGLDPEIESKLLQDIYTKNTISEEIAKEIKSKTGTSQIIEMLSVVHDEWVRNPKNADKFLQPGRDREYQFVPLQLLKWKEVASDLLFLKPILEAAEVRVDEKAIEEQFEITQKEFLIDHGIDSLDRLKFKLRQGSDFYPVLEGIETKNGGNIDELLKDDKILEKMAGQVEGQSAIKSKEELAIDIIHSKNPAYNDVYRVKTTENDMNLPEVDEYMSKKAMILSKLIGHPHPSYVITGQVGRDYDKYKTEISEAGRDYGADAKSANMSSLAQAARKTDREGKIGKIEFKDGAIYITDKELFVAGLEPEEMGWEEITKERVTEKKAEYSKLKKELDALKKRDSFGKKIEINRLEEEVAEAKQSLEQAKEDYKKYVVTPKAMAKASEKNEVTKSEISGVKGFFDKVLGKENIDRDNGKDEK